MDFTVDTMCGRLVSYLRFCGYDTEYIEQREAGDRAAIADELESAGRTLITRDHTFASMADRAILLTEMTLDEQLRSLSAQGVHLSLPAEPIRCGRCNGELDEVVEAHIEPPEYVPTDLDEELYRCRSCGQYFWRGSHWDRVNNRLDSVLPPEE